MKVHVHRKKSGKFLGTIEISADATAEQFKAKFYEQYKYYPERQRFHVAKADGPVLKEGTLASNAITHDTAVYFKDLGVQISWRLVFVLEYLGPLFIVPALWFFPGLFYGVEHPRRHTAQTLGFALMLIHFLKREFETLFIHRFSNATMPIVRLPLNCGHYWLLCGLLIGWFLCHPLYHPPFENRVLLYGLASLMMVFEFANFQTHVILRNLRARGTRVRGIPRGCGFEMTSCANYTWETAAWITYSTLVGCLTSWIFTVVAFLQMAEWAQKKHRAYLKEFPEYPRSRKAIVPFIL